MNKYLLALSLMLVPVSSFAMDLYHYSPIEGCSLRKAVGATWVVAQPSEVGSDNFTIQISKANAAYSNFKYQGSWYAAKTECFKLSDAPMTSDAGSSSAHSGPAGKFSMKKGKLFVEPKFAFYIMNGAGTSGGVDASGTTYDKYSAGLGIALKLGYYLSEHTDLFLEYNKFSGSQTASNSGSSSKADDSITSFNLGYQYFLSKMGSFLPYGELALGYNKLSKTIPVLGELTGSGIGFVIEAGVLYDVSEKIALMGALNYTIMNFSELNQPGVALPQTNVIGHSHIGINFGARYNF